MTERVPMVCSGCRLRDPHGYVSAGFKHHCGGVWERDEPIVMVSTGGNPLSDESAKHLRAIADAAVRLAERSASETAND